MSDEFDAFGRKRDESGLGDLGWGATDDRPPAESKPTMSATPQTEFRTVTPAGSAMGRPRRNPAIFLVQAIIVVAIAIGVFVAATGGSDNAVNRVVNPIPDNIGGSGGGKTGNDGDDDVPPQVRERDYFTASGLRAGLRILQREQPGRISNFSMRRDRIDVQVVRGGKTHIIDFPSDAEVPDELNASDTSSSTIPTFSYEELNPGAPERLMKAANARLDRSKADVDYFVAQKWSGSMQWGVYYKGGNPIAQGDSRGRYTRRIS